MGHEQIVLLSCRSEALAVGKIYTSLLNEFGRAVGNDLNAISTLAGGSLKSLNPISLGIDKLQFHLESLISFLQVGCHSLPGMRLLVHCTFHKLH